VEIVKTLHVKFFPFGSVEPVGSVTVKRREALVLLMSGRSTVIFFYCKLPPMTHKTIPNCETFLRIFLFLSKLKKILPILVKTAPSE